MSRRGLVALAGGTALVVEVALAPAPTTTSASVTDASFTDAEVGRVSITAAELAAPRARDCRIGLAATSATLRWRAPDPEPPDYTYEWELLNPDGSRKDGGEVSSDVTTHEVSAGALLGVGVRQVFRVRTVSGNWVSPWRTAHVSTTLSALGLAIIGNCSWD